ncbi:hypothetical protein L3W71_03495 [Escherichia coli]|nr:hypothetical protein [Escherichia coli]MCF7302075.1 hypothetical protein [Escherichia coli]
MRPLMPPVQTPDNLFHDGNPLTGELGTIVDAGHLNNVQGTVRDTQSELLTILASAGINVDPTKQNQLLTALKALLLSRSNPFGDIKTDGAAAIATALANLGLGPLQTSFTDKSGKIALNGGWGVGIRNEQIAGTMAALDVSRFDYFAPKDNIGPIPGQWVGGITHAMGDQIGWQIAGLGQGAVGGSPRAFMRMKLSNGNFSDWGELYHTLNKPTASDVGALPVNGKAASASAADTAAKLTTARKIAGVAFDGTADISLGPDNVGAVSAGGGDYNKNFRFGSVATLGNESNPVQLISAASGQAADNFVAWTSYTWYQDYVRTGVVMAGNTTIKSFAVEINGVRFLEIGRDGTLLNGNMASDLRLGQQESMNVNIPGSGLSTDSVVPSGCYVTGLTSTSTGNYIGITKIFYRRLQRKVAGNWVDATWL